MKAEIKNWVSQWEKMLSPEQIALALRLCVDPRLKSVWNELARRKHTPQRERLYPNGAG
jgi:hypothetical protein